MFKFIKNIFRVPKLSKKYLKEDELAPFYLVCREICQLSDFTINNLILQKIFYLIYRDYLGKTGKDLCEAGFRATMYGPIETNSFERYRIYGISPVKKDIFYENIHFEENDSRLQFIKDSFLIYGKLSHVQLIGITEGRKSAWSVNYTTKFDAKISKYDIKHEYSNFWIRPFGLK